MSRRETESEFIRRRREDLGMSQEELALAIGKHHKQYIANIESGRVGVPVWMIVDFAKALKVSVTKLIVLRLKAYEVEVRKVVFGRGVHKR